MEEITHLRNQSRKTTSTMVGKKFMVGKKSVSILLRMEERELDVSRQKVILMAVGGDFGTDQRILCNI